MVAVLDFEASTIHLVIICILNSFPIAPAGPPQDLKIIVTSSTGLMVSWEPPAPEDQNGEIVGYSVTVETEEQDRVSRSTQTHFIAGGGSSNFSLEGLHPFTNYTITVSASTQVGEGPPTPPQTVQTPEDGESKHKIHIHCKLTLRHLGLSWTVER